jgi:glycosyltransferase involved in cell wall biosynthesis
MHAAEVYGSPKSIATGVVPPPEYGASTISVVIPTYNYGRFVTEAVESALAQTYRPMEVIVVDDGSTDDTAERLRPYMDRIRYIRQENRGLSAARNTGIRHAQGEWVALLDSDDVWHPRKTEIQLRTVGEDTSIGFVGSPECGGIAQTLSDNSKVRELRVRDFLTKPPVCPSSVMIRRRCFDDVGLFDETLTSVEDRDMWLRLAARFRSLQVCSPCWSYRQHAGQMNRHADRMLANYTRVLKKFFREYPEQRGLRRFAFGHLNFDAVWSYCSEGRRFAAMRRLALSVWYYPAGFIRERPNLPFARLKVAIRLLTQPRLVVAPPNSEKTQDKSLSEAAVA